MSHLKSTLPYTITVTKLAIKIQLSALYSPLAPSGAVSSAIGVEHVLVILNNAPRAAINSIRSGLDERSTQQRVMSNKHLLPFQVET